MMPRALLVAGLIAATLSAGTAQEAAFRVGEVLPAWSPGTLDIHQIVTGRGNAAFARFPDGTTMLIDAGGAGETPYAAPRPDATRTPGEWIARYVRHMMNAEAARIDYAVLTHFHPDHMGAVAQVADAVPIRRLIDRGWPAYDYLAPPGDQLFDSYRQFVAARLSVDPAAMIGARAGSRDQIVPLKPGAMAAPFEVRVVSVNDHVWSGQGDGTTVRFPALNAIALAEDRPTENMCSVTLRISYGAFSYFTGGDMPGYPVPGAPSWHDLETAVAHAIGPTDVHVVNHHGSIEAANPFWLATLRSRVMVLPAWAATHPSPDVLKRLLSRRLYPEPRDIFVTAFREETRAAIGARANQVASAHGHIVVRVEPGGERYWVLVLDDTAESYRITSVHGPYLSR